MPQRRSQDLSPRRRIGIVGTDARQRVRLIRHPLSLHYISEGPSGLVQISAPPPSPNLTGGSHPVLARQHLSLEWDGMRVRMCF
jgi:hypothetical protein